MLFARKNQERTQSLEEHLEGTTKILQKILSYNHIKFDPNFVKLIGFLHDCGKADKKWQTHYPRISQYPHSLLALPLLHTLAKKLELNEKEKLLLVAIIISHHRPLYRGLYSDKSIKPEYDSEIFRILQKHGWEISEEDVKHEIIRKRYDLMKREYITQEISVNKLLDKYFSQLYPLEKDKNFIELFWKLQGALIEADFLNVGHWENKQLELEDFYFPYRNFSFEKKPEGEFSWQKECNKTISPAIIIRMPTGTGKTEGSLLWAKNHKPKRLFYVLPVTFAINAMYERLKKYFKNVGIYHNWSDIFLHEGYSEDLDNYIYFKHMLRPVQVTTPDQILLSFIHWKRWTVKLFSFLNSTFIFDEIHTYDPLLFSHLRILTDTLRKKFNAKIGIITATFPTQLLSLEEFKDFVLLPEKCEKYYEERRVGKINYETEFLQEWLKDNREKIENEWRNKKILIVVNTVQRAQEIFDLLTDIKGRNIKLIHGRFILKDRIKKEKTITSEENSKNTILIATQIVEVSLDIDYDILLTELAPLDALIQRMGRVNRHRKREAEVFIFDVPSYEPYEKEIMEKVKEKINDIVKAKNDLHLLKIFDGFFANIFPLFCERYEDAKETWERYSEDIWAFTANEYKFHPFLREIKVINIPAIPRLFVNELHSTKKEAEECWERFKQTGSTKDRKLALEHEIKIKSHRVEVPIWTFKKCYWDERLKEIIIDANYDSKKGLLLKEENHSTVI